MLVCMRTTVILPDALAAAAKQRAATEGRTFTSLVEEGLRTVLARTDPVEPVDLPTHDSGRMNVDILDKDALWSVLDADSTK